MLEHADGSIRAMAQVHLNVGGRYFHTYRSTLRESPSLLAALVNHAPDAMEIFVDRDPTHFRHVLNWLRGVRWLPDDRAVLGELMWESDYYSIGGLQEAIHCALASAQPSVQHSLGSIARNAGASAL